MNSQKNKIVFATRSSKLALWQTNYVKNEILKFFPDLEVEIKEIKTKGDHILDVSLSKIGDKGLFTKEIEEALLRNEADIAVHSLKDLPTALPLELSICGVLKRELPNDVLLLRSKEKINHFLDLKSDLKIGTSSLRRIAQLKSLRPDLKYIDLRGNLDTRIKKLEDGLYDGIVLAKAGIKRLGYENFISYEFNFHELLPAVGQGAIAIEIRKNDLKLEQIISKLNDYNSFICTFSERAFLRELQGGCQVPIGAYSEIVNNTLILHGVIASLDGRKIVKDKIIGEINDFEVCGKNLAQMLLRNGGDEILRNIR